MEVPNVLWPKSAGKMTVFATGGHVREIAAELRFINEINEDLTLEESASDLAPQSGCLAGYLFNAFSQETRQELRVAETNCSRQLRRLTVGHYLCDVLQAVFHIGE